MTVKQLIEHLEEMPRESKVLIENSDMYVNGLYEVSYIIDYEDGTLELCSNYEKNYSEGGE